MLESIRYTVIRTFLSMYPRTYMEDPMELEHGVTTTTMARDLPHPSSIVHGRVELFLHLSDK